VFELACIQGNLNIVKFLILNGVDLEKPSPSHVMRLATESKNVILVQYLMMSLGFRERLHCDDVADLLTCTGNTNDYKMAEFYLEQGVDINVTNCCSQSLFHVACTSPKDNVKFLKWLIQRGSDMNLVQQHGWNGLHYACFHGNLNIVKFLVEKGIDINQTTSWGMTGFDISCDNNPNLEIMQYLFCEGYDINRPDDDGLTVLECLDSSIHSCLTEQKTNTFCLCILFLIEQGGRISDEQLGDFSSEVRLAIKNRMIEITCMKDQIFERFTEPVAQIISDFTMLPITESTFQTILQILLKMI
jgi:hypothetical protein